MPFRDSLIITQKGAFLQAKDTLSRRFRRVFIKFSFSGCGFIRFPNENVPESTWRRRMQEIVLLHEGVVNRLNRAFIVRVVHADDNRQFARPLINHADVDARLAHRREQARSRAAVVHLNSCFLIIVEIVPFVLKMEIVDYRNLL